MVNRCLWLKFYIALSVKWHLLNRVKLSEDEDFLIPTPALIFHQKYL
jgi:hypothetical protein